VFYFLFSGILQYKISGVLQVILAEQVQCCLPRRRPTTTYHLPFQPLSLLKSGLGLLGGNTKNPSFSELKIGLGLFDV